VIESVAVPFTASFQGNVLTTVGEIRGVLRSEHEALVVEFRATKVDYNNPLHRSEGDVQTAAIPWTEIQSLAYRRRLFGGGRIELRTRGLRSLEALPNAEGNEVTLKVRRADGALARELVSVVELARAEARLRDLEGAEPPFLPPP
jgi:hypothetical protein